MPTAFVYGTLTDRERAESVLESVEFGEDATLEGLHRVDGEYPTLAPGGSVESRLIRTPDVDDLDAYERVDRGLYVRASVPMAGGMGTVETSRNSRPDRSSNTKQPSGSRSDSGPQPSCVSPGPSHVAPDDPHFCIPPPPTWRNMLNRRQLTDRQAEVLKTADEMGHLDHPKGANANQVADELGITAMAFTEHNAAAQRKVSAAVIDE